MLLNLNFFFKDLDGNEVKSEKNVAGTLAEMLCTQTDGIGAVKAYDWALQFHKNGEIEIDRSDLSLLEAFVEKSQFANFAKAQLLNAMKAVVA